MDKVLAEAILQALQRRTGGQLLVCKACGGTRWKGTGIISLSIQDTLSAGLVIGGKALPLADLTCQVCGLTEFFNIKVLLGKEKFDEIVKQQRERKQIMNEAEEIIKQRRLDDNGSTKETN